MEIRITSYSLYFQHLTMWTSDRFGRNIRIGKLDLGAIRQNYLGTSQCIPLHYNRSCKINVDLPQFL